MTAVAAPAGVGGGMTLVEHLTELRRRLVVSVAAIAVGATIGFLLYERLLNLLLDPYASATGKRTLFVTDPLEGFQVRLKVAAIAGLLLASPVVVWQAWRFITPGLHRREKRFAIPFVLASTLLFAIGSALAYYTLPRALEFLVSIGGPHLETIFSPGRYLGLIMFMMLAFGLAFEFPLVLVFLQLVGIVTPRRLSSWRRWTYVGVFAAVAIITPSQDPYSLFALAVPMCLFYELSIVAGRLIARRRVLSPEGES